MDDFGTGTASYALKGAPVQDFAASELFERTFQEGMDLVEETAAYLDGGGRQESKLLSRNAALAYAGESMRLTTQLMQVASWLLVQRAVREGFRGCTVVTIAHRLETVSDYDLIVELEAGRVKRCGAPADVMPGGRLREE